MCERTWVQLLYMLFVYYLIIIVFNNMLEHVEG